MIAAAWRGGASRVNSQAEPSPRLSPDELLQLLEELRTTDPQGALLIEAYLDRRSHGWRNRRSDDGARGGPRQPRGPRGRMTSKEAYDGSASSPARKERRFVLHIAG